MRQPPDAQAAQGDAAQEGNAQGAAAVADGLPAPRRHVAVLAVSLGSIVTTVDGGIVNVALPTLARDLQVAPSEAVLIVTAYQLMLMMSLLPLSALGDRFGQRRVYQTGLSVFVLATMLCFFAKSLPLLVAVRSVQALGAAAALSVSSALIRSIYPSSRLGRGLSFNTVIAASAASLAPTLGGALLGLADWPWLFVSLAPFGLLSLLIGRKALPESPTRNEPYDLRGALMCAAMFGLVIAGLESAVHGGSLPVSALLVGVGAAVGFVFVRRELGQARPVFPVDLLKHRKITLSALGLLAAYIGYMVLMLSLPFRLQQQFHFTPAETGIVLAPWPLIIMFAAPISGMLSDRVPAGLLGGAGMLIAMIGLVSFTFLPDAPSHLDIIWRISFCGLGFGMFFSPNSRQIIGGAPMERAAAAGALTSTTRGTGQTLGATAVATLLASGIGLGSAPPLISAGLALLACLCTLATLGGRDRLDEI